MKLKNYIAGTKAFEAIILQKLTNKRTPVLASIFVTSKCNLKCNYCFINEEHKNEEDFTIEEIYDVVDELHKLGTSVIDLMGGEPLMRGDIGEIIDYINNKKIFCEILTNGYFVKKQIDSLKNVDSVCLSLDGDESSHDTCRGQGSYKKVLEALEILKKNDINTRIHMTLTKNNVNSLGFLAKLSKENNVTLNAAQAVPNEAENTQNFPNDSEIRSFLKELKRYVDGGYPIYNTMEGINYALMWPYPYSHRLKKGDISPDFTPIPCKRKHLNCYIGGNGMMYPCTGAYIEKFGLNIKEVGVKKAWEYLENFDCEACGYFGEVEANMLLNGNLRSLKNAVRYSI